jgi:hypothetical protein
VRIVSRAEWGAAAARSQTRLDPARVTRFVLHHTTGRYAGPQTVRQIQAFHQGPERKWACIGYNFLIAPDGTIFEGRGWGLTGAHARGYNSTSIGVAFIGDGRQPVPDAALQSIVWLAGEADRRFGRLDRVGHRDVGSTVCPGDVLYGWWMGVGREPIDVVEPEPVVSPVVSVPVVDEDGWHNRPSWVPKQAWQNLIDWRNSR